MMTDKQIAELEAVAQENRDIVARETSRTLEAYEARADLYRREGGSVARAVDYSLMDVEKVVVRNALGADAARAAGATDAEVLAVVETCNALIEALNALSLSVRS